MSKKFEEYKRITSSSDTRNFEPTTENLGAILNYIVSNKQELGDGYVHRDFWHQNGKELLEFRERPEIKNYTIAVENSCKKLLELTDKILEDLEAIVNKYREKYAISFNLF